MVKRSLICLASLQHRTLLSHWLFKEKLNFLFSSVIFFHRCHLKRLFSLIFVKRDIFHSPNSWKSSYLTDSHWLVLPRRSRYSLPLAPHLHRFSPQPRAVLQEPDHPLRPWPAGPLFRGEPGIFWSVSNPETNLSAILVDKSDWKKNTLARLLVCVLANNLTSYVLFMDSRRFLDQRFFSTDWSEIRFFCLGHSGVNQLGGVFVSGEPFWR